MIQNRSYGSGKPLIFIHGFCEDSTMWDGFCQPFAKNYKVYLIDLPGFGKSPLPNPGFTITDVANQVAEWMQSETLKNADIIGHSLGGYVILELVKNHPELVGRFGLFHSTAFADSDEKRKTRNHVIKFVEKNGVEVFADSFVPQLFYAPNREHLENEIKTAVNTARKTPQETLVSYTKAMRDRNDRTDVLQTFAKPILFIAGDQDTSVPLTMSQKQIPMIQNGVTGILKSTGHMGMFEAKEESTAYIQRFLQG